VVIVTGFQGMDDLGNITTPGRGGSDTSPWPWLRP
jgi:aspartate kinase